MKNDQNLCNAIKSSDDEKSARIRAKVSVGAAGCPLPFSSTLMPKIHENP